MESITPTTRTPTSENNSTNLSPPAPASDETYLLTSDKTAWDAFDWSNRTHADAKPVIVDWFNGLPDSGALILSGNCGTGKTHLAHALRDVFGRWRASFYEETTFIRAIQATYDGGELSEAQLIRQVLYKRELFILDDLGTYQTDNLKWLQNVYSYIFEDYMTVRRRPLLITTNLTFVDIRARIGERAFSRLTEAMKTTAAYVDLFGLPDYRLKNLIARSQ